MPLSPKRYQQYLLEWFQQHGRKHLPWQENKTPYRVWVSEVMLQQTQVTTVIAYYQRFMQSFPTVAALAAASEDAVLHHWAGLGYYSRARNLHKSAQRIMMQHSGKFPNTLEDLQQLPGIGRSTAGAILAIAYEEPAPILDGNVKRVLSRVLGLTDPINESRTEKTLWELAEKYTPSTQVADYTQAIMDLGATCCTRTQPQCERCPFVKHCLAYKQDLVDQIPAKIAKRAIPTRECTLLILQHQRQVLLHKRPTQGIWGGLWSFPELAGKVTGKALHQQCKTLFQLQRIEVEPLAAFTHIFTHFRLIIHPVVIRSRTLQATNTAIQQWYHLDTPSALGLPKPIAKLVSQLHKAA